MYCAFWGGREQVSRTLCVYVWRSISRNSVNTSVLTCIAFYIYAHTQFTYGVKSRITHLTDEQTIQINRIESDVECWKRHLILKTSAWQCCLTWEIVELSVMANIHGPGPVVQVRNTRIGRLPEYRAITTTALICQVENDIIFQHRPIKLSTTSFRTTLVKRTS